MFKIFYNSSHIVIKILGITIKFKSYLSYFYNQVYRIDKSGKRKRLYMPAENVNINFKGKNAVIEIPESKYLKNLKIIAGENSKICIKNPHFWGIHNLFIEIQNNCEVFIDENFNCASGEIICFGYKNSIKIGRDCMFAKNFIIRTDDGHVIYDNTTMEIINKPKDVSIGDHVWFCQDVSILKGVTLNNNTVVAKSSVVSKSIESPNVIVGGCPAKIIKNNINWDRKNYYDYCKFDGENNA